MYLSGQADEPMRTSAPYVDFGTAMLSALGTVAALLERRETGVGQHVEASLLGTALTIGSSALIEQQLTKANRVALGNLSPSSAPNDVFQTRDGWIILQTVGDPMFARVAELIGERASKLSPNSRRRGFPAGRSTHLRRRSTIRMSWLPGSCSRWTIRARPKRRCWRRHRCRCRPAEQGSGVGRQPWESTRTRS